MTRKIDARRWIALFLVSILFIVLLFCSMIYVIDPFLQFRIKDNAYALPERYVCGGLIKNYDYDTLIVGSSMTQNFNMDVFRKELGVSPLHIGIGGLSWPEIDALLRYANSKGKADSYYVCLDLSTFTNDSGETLVPNYLLNDSFLSKIRYALSYNAWFEYIPLDAALMLLKTVSAARFESLESNTSIDLLGDWSNEYTFDESVVIENYKKSAYAVSTVDNKNLLSRMKVNIDAFIKDLNIENASYYFFFPPYSALYWCNAQEEGYYDEFLEAKSYLIQRLADMGCAVYDFQAEDFTLDLNNYKDTTHYSPHINDWMVHCFASTTDLVSPDIEGDFCEQIKKNTDIFRSQHSDLFIKTND